MGCPWARGHVARGELIERPRHAPHRRPCQPTALAGVDRYCRARAYAKRSANTALDLSVHGKGGCLTKKGMCLRARSR